MPEIESRILGKIEVADNSLYHLNGSILAFEDYDEFYLVNMDGEGTFKILQSKDDKKRIGYIFAYYREHSKRRFKIYDCKSYSANSF